MSWQERIQDNIIIVTGDGKRYNFRLWLGGYRTIEYNIAQFNFPNLKGTKVDRGKPMGQKIELELYLQGENHLDECEAFRISSEDERDWQLTHPYYGLLNVQPTGLAIDNTNGNVSLLRLTVIETITQDAPRTTVDPKDKISADKDTSDAVLANAFSYNVPSPGISEINQMGQNNASVYKEGSKKVRTTIDAQSYFNSFNEANSAILSATIDPIQAIRTLQAVISAPAYFAQGVEERVDLLIDQFALLQTMVAGSVTYAYKKIFESNAGALISSLAYAASTPLTEDDYGTRNDVIRVIEKILNAHAQYIFSLDSLQSQNGGSKDSFIPDFESLSSINSVVDYTVSNLFNIALNSKQERTIILEDDSNAILLTHRFYGLDEADDNLNKFIRTNNIGLTKLLEIKKGSPIIYYV